MPQQQMKDMPDEVIGKSFIFRPSDHCRNLRIRSRSDSTQPPFDLQRADAADMVMELEDLARGIRQAYGIPDNQGSSEKP